MLTPTINSDWSEAEAAKIAATLPHERAELLQLARDTVQQLHNQIVAGDDDGACQSARIYDAIVWTMNGRTFFGTIAGPESGGNVVAEFCRAEPGTVPLWPQRGEFLIVEQGIRAVWTHGEGYGFMNSMCSLQAVDVDAPFISETGFRSIFVSAVPGMTVDEVARAALRQLIAEKGRVPIARDSRQFVRERTAKRAWLAQAPALSAAEMAYEDRHGQMALGF